MISIVSIDAFSQIELKGEYIGSSAYWDDENNKTAGKGDAKIFSGNAQIPFSIKLNDNNRPTVWGMNIGVAYTTMENKNMTTDICPDEILNAQISFMHIRPISQNWSILASLGAGVYTAHTNLSKLGMKNVLGSGALIFIWHLNKNLDLGIGPAINTSFGYPMAFPAIYLKWELSGRYQVKVAMMNALEISAGMQINKSVTLQLIGEMGGALALEKVQDKDMMFSHQYMIAGFRPEFTLGKISIPVTVGISGYRPAFYQERSLKAFFKDMGKEYDSHFSLAPYISTGIKYKF